ncbi:MAG TPA: hypothetical protein VFZ21_31660 [Gemmatimonadaceae bacterium]|nr:hypothetical protein [Gemmatimonadaceae bacterium]
MTDLSRHLAETLTRFVLGMGIAPHLADRLLTQAIADDLRAGGRELRAAAHARLIPKGGK